MKQLVSQFRRDEDGAVTVDWVVLTALIIGMTLGIILILQTAATDPANSIGAYLGNRQI